MTRQSDDQSAVGAELASRSLELRYRAMESKALDNRA
jgi:hypothetical protein